MTVLRRPYAGLVAALTILRSSHTPAINHQPPLRRARPFRAL
jgi:hypothetical protein